MRPNGFIVAHAQVWGMLVGLMSLIAMIFMVLSGHSILDSTTEKLAYTMLGVFLSQVGQMVNYFFQRQRVDGPSVPTEPAAPANKGEAK